MNEEFNDNPMIDNELQVRLMNLVLGEASDFERDQLQTMMEQARGAGRILSAFGAFAWTAVRCGRWRSIV